MLHCHVYDVVTWWLAGKWQSTTLTLTGLDISETWAVTKWFGPFRHVWCEEEKKVLWLAGNRVRVAAAVMRDQHVHQNGKSSNRLSLFYSFNMCDLCMRVHNFFFFFRRLSFMLICKFGLHVCHLSVSRSNNDAAWHAFSLCYKHITCSAFQTIIKNLSCELPILIFVLFSCWRCRSLVWWTSK